MKPMHPLRHAFAYVTLGLLVGWYHFILILYSILLFAILYFKSIAAGLLLGIFIVLSFTPIKSQAWESLTYAPFWKIWLEYFDYSWDDRNIKNKMEKGKKYIFLEFPHGIYPMGQMLSINLIRTIFDNWMIYGIGADIIFKFPILRQFYAWVGTYPAGRSNITKILNKKDGCCAIIPGGIAEMYIISEDKETIYLRKRKSTVRAAIEEGASIFPIFFFGNSKLFKLVGQSDSDSWLSKLSRKLRMSLIFFYGRHGLTVPFRHPIRMVAGDLIPVTQADHPTDEQVDVLMNKIIEAVQHLYETQKPEWETRPLVIL